MSEEDIFSGLFIGAIFGSAIVAIIIGFCFHWQNPVNPETFEDICKNLTNSTSVGYTIEDGKLICEVPSYDHTQNIIIRSNSQSDKGGAK